MNLDMATSERYGTHYLPRVRFEHKDVYDAEPHVPGDAVQMRIDDAKPYERRHRPYRQSLALDEKRCNLGRQDARL